jgi:hypothetical protein
MKLLWRYRSAMRSLSVSVALLALAALAPGAARAQQITTTKVTYTVTDPTGAAIPDARILVPWGTTFGFVSTDIKGQLSVDMKPGRYNLPVVAAGYISDHIYVDLTSAAGPTSATKNVTVVLDPDDRFSQKITSTTVTFTVTDPSGAAIANATIVLGFPSTAPEMKTDEHGQLSVIFQIGAQYNLPVSAPGYISDHIYFDLTSAELPADATKNVTVVLHPEDRHSQTGPKSRETLLVTGDANHSPLNLSLTDFRALPHVDVKVHNGHTNTDESYSGVPLAALLAKVHAPLGENLRGKALNNYVIATASDGYSVVLSLGEIDLSFHGGQIVIADARDGQPLTTSGPYQLIVPEDKRPARWVRNLVTISMESVH